MLRRSLLLLPPLAVLLAGLFFFRTRLATWYHTRGELGGMSILVTDHREALADFQSLKVTVPRVFLHREGAPPLLDWLEFPTSIPTFELTELRNGSIVALTQPRLAPGRYDALRLEIAAAEGITRDGRTLRVPIRVQPLSLEAEAWADDVTPVLVDLTVFELGDHGGGYALVSTGVFAGEEAVEARLNPPRRRGTPVPAPEFTLTDQQGREVSLSDHRGKVVVFTPIFTHCLNTCPIYTAKFAEVQQELERRGWEDEVQLLMITVDPERDTVEVLQDYAEQRGVTWPILTGSPQEVLQVLEEFRIQRQIVPLENAEGLEDWDGRGHELYDVVHVAALVIIDPEGRMTFGMSGVDWYAEDVITAIADLVEGGHADQRPEDAP